MPEDQTQRTAGGGAADGPLLSVILPSFNGADTLDRTLTALAGLERPPGGTEFILIDNNSRDATARLMAAHAPRLGARVLAEARQGKSCALNTAIAAAAGRLLLFFDDDVLPDPDCLLRYAEAAERHPEIGLFAGQVRPGWERPAPAWLEHLCQIGRACACTPADRAEGLVTPMSVKGSNLLVRRAAMGAIRFDEDRLNFHGTSLRGGAEDTGLALDLSLAGQRILYLPSARVRHQVQPQEMTAAAVFARYLRIGRSATLRDLSRGCRPKPARYRRVLKLLVRMAARTLAGNTPRAAEHMVRAAEMLGGLQARRIAREKAEQPGPGLSEPRAAPHPRPHIAEEGPLR